MNSIAKKGLAASFGLVVAFAAGNAGAQTVFLNGDFSEGNSGFGSDYTYSDWDDYPGHSQYTVSANPNLWNSSFPAPPAWVDHTPTSDNLALLVNGSTTDGLDFWSQTVSVQPNTQYAVSGWASSLYPGSEPNLARLQMFINGTAVGSAYDVLDGAPNWQYFEFAFNSGNATQAKVALHDLSTALFPNDFAVDDLSIVAVPEPSVLALVGVGMALGLRRRTR